MCLVCVCMKYECVSVYVCAVYVDLMTVLMGFSNNKTKGVKSRETVYS